MYVNNFYELKFGEDILTKKKQNTSPHQTLTRNDIMP